MDFGKRTIRVAGQDVELDVKGELVISDLSSDMDQVASRMAWWASVWASAEAEAVEADAFYRHWRAKTMTAISHADPKTPEWKMKALVEADPKFLEMKKGLALAEQNVTLARAVFDSLSKKANALQSKGAMVRGELERTGMSTPSEPRRRPRPATSEDVRELDGDVRRERMREANRENPGKKTRLSDG